MAEPGLSTVPEKTAAPAEDSPSLTTGQLGMWLFISVEVMLFAAIMAAYLVYRLSSLGQGWPSPSQMHVSMVAGIVNTVILVLSGVTAWSMYNAAREDRSLTARIWLIVTLLLGTGFLTIKSFEYYEKYQVGLMPVPGKQQIYNQATHQYVAAVNEDLKNQIARLESKAENAPDTFSETDRQRLELVYSLKQHMTESTARTVANTPGPYNAHLAMKLMAYQIMPHPDTARNVEEVLEPEMDSLRFRMERYSERLELIRRRQQLVEAQIAALEEEVRQMLLLAPAGQESAEVKARQEWLGSKRQQKEALEIEARRVENNITPVAGRIDNLVSTVGSGDGNVGINEKHQLRLPVVVTNGQAWISIYLLLTGAHAVHLLGGLLALLWWVPGKLTTRQAPALYVVCMYWQFVDVVWLCIFWFIYF